MRLPKLVIGLLVLSGLILWAGNLKAEKARGILLIITTNDTETVWQALRLANFALSQGDEVRIYLTGKGVEMLTMGDEPLDVAQKLETFLENGGEVYGWKKALKMHGVHSDKVTPAGRKAFYQMIWESDKVLVY